LAQKNRKLFFEKIDNLFVETKNTLFLRRNTMPEINGTNNNSVQSMLESLNQGFTSGSSNNSSANPFSQTNSSREVSEMANQLLKSFATGAKPRDVSEMANDILKGFSNTGTTGTNTASPLTPTTETKPAVQPTPAPKKRRRGFLGGLFKKGGFLGGLFKGISNAFKGIGKFLKAALPVLSTLAMFVPGIGTAIGGALKIATAAMGAFDAIKNKNPLGFLSSVAGAFTGGATNLLGKMGSVGGFVQKGLDFFKNSGVGSLVTKGLDFFNKGKDYLNKFTGGLGEKVGSFLNTKGLDIFKNLSGGIGGKIGEFLTKKGPEWISGLASSASNKVTSWLNDKATSLFNKITDIPLVNNVRNFFNGGIGKSLLDLFTKKA
jgi:hypothetical protein